MHERGNLKFVSIAQMKGTLEGFPIHSSLNMYTLTSNAPCFHHLYFMNWSHNLSGGMLRATPNGTRRY